MHAHDWGVQFGESSSDDLRSLGAVSRGLQLIHSRIDEGLKAVATYHRWLYDGVRRGTHQPVLDDFIPTIKYLVAMQRVLDDAIATELQLAQRFSSWTEIGAVFGVSRQGAQRLSRHRNRTHALRPDLSSLDARLFFLELRRESATAERSDPDVTDYGWARDLPSATEFVQQSEALRLLRYKSFEELMIKRRKEHETKRKERALKAQERRARERAEREAAHRED